VKKSSILIVFLLLVSQTAWIERNTDARQRRVDVEGTIDVLYEDPEDGNARTVFYLNTGTDHIELKLNSGVQLLTGSRVRVRGRMHKGTLNVEHSEIVNVAQTTSMNNALGEQRQLVMLFNFQDQPTNRPWTASNIQDLFLNQVNGYWQNVSYGQTWVTADFTGWYTIPVNSTDCSANLTQAADDGARALGYDPNNYSHLIYIFPSCGCRSQSGTTYVSSNPQGYYKTWVYLCGMATFRTATHEFGHSLGFAHANSLNCSGVTIGSNCSVLEYGDYYDVMGAYSNTCVSSAYYRDLAGWSGARLLTVTSDGLYTISPIENTDNGLKSLRIPVQSDASTSSVTYYYIEYRQPVGYDSYLSNYQSIINGVLVHKGEIVDGYHVSSGSLILDMTPTVTGRNESLLAGQSFYDPNIGLTVTLVSVDSLGATVSVRFGTSTCVKSPPTVQLVPVSSQPAAPGAPVTYNATITNNNSAGCSAATFNLQAGVPSGWSASLGSSTLSISPGSSVTTSLQVLSPSTAASGNYPISVSAANSADSSNSATGSATCRISPSLGVAVSTDKTRYSRNQSVSVTSAVTAGGSPVVGASVSFSITKSNGAVVNQTGVTGTTGSVTVQFRIRKQDPVGSYQAQAIATLNKMTGTGAVSFAVQ
jgi:hypothetical protein